MADLTYRRQKAIDDLLRLMGCTDAKQSKCEHVAAITELADACYMTLYEQIDDLTGGLLTQYGLRPKTETLIKPGVRGYREGRLK